MIERARPPTGSHPNGSTTATISSSGHNFDVTFVARRVQRLRDRRHMHARALTPQVLEHMFSMVPTKRRMPKQHDSTGL
jgi:hypothetical protein